MFLELVVRLLSGIVQIAQSKAEVASRLKPQFALLKRMVSSSIALLAWLDPEGSGPSVVADIKGVKPYVLLRQVRDMLALIGDGIALPPALPSNNPKVRTSSRTDVTWQAAVLHEL